jgi:hypothetical protein
MEQLHEAMKVHSCLFVLCIIAVYAITASEDNILCSYFAYGLRTLDTGVVSACASSGSIGSGSSSGSYPIQYSALMTHPAPLPIIPACHQVLRWTERDLAHVAVEEEAMMSGLRVCGALAESHKHLALALQGGCQYQHDGRNCRLLPGPGTQQNWLRELRC